MAALTDPLSALQELNRKAGFNVWAGIEVLHAESGAVVIGMPWRIEAGQYTGFLHAGVIAALIDTASWRCIFQLTASGWPVASASKRMPVWSRLDAINSSRAASCTPLPGRAGAWWRPARRF